MEKLSPYDLWKSFQSYVNTYQGGWYRPQTDFIQRVNDIQMELWNELAAKSEKSQEARDNLIFFLKTKNIIAKEAKGNYSEVVPPADYGRFASMNIVYAQNNKTYPSPDVDNGTCEGYNDVDAVNDYLSSLQNSDVQLIDNQRWSACLQHVIKKPTLSKPKCTEINEKFLVAPRGVSVVVLNYYVKPENAVFAYTLSPSNRQTGAGAQIIYDKSKSKDLNWPVTIKNEFIIRLGESYGIFTREQFLTAVNAAQKVA